MHIKQQQKLNLFLMLFSIITLLFVYTGFFVFEFGIYGHIFSYIWIALGLKSIYELYQQKHMEQPEYANNSDLQQFFRLTREMWLRNEFTFYSSDFLKQIRRQTPSQFAYERRPIKGNALSLFLERQAPLREGEYMIGMGDLGELYDSDPHFVLTNMRWFQKVGLPNEERWENVELNKLASAEVTGDTKDNEYGSLRLCFRSGESKQWDGIIFFPVEEAIEYAINHA